MSIKSLPWRIGVPFASFVIVGSVVLVAWTWWSIESEERTAFEKLAQTNAQFIRQMRLPPTERMARKLGEVLGVGVSFRTKDGFTPPLNGLLSIATAGEFERLPADGRFDMIGGWQSVVVPLDGGVDLVLTKPLNILPQALLHPRTIVELGAFWLAAVLFAWLLTRRLVRPLQHLAARLPEIEQPGRLDLPEAERGDEIGDVARAFLRTRAALHSEREQRERAEKLAVLGRMTAALAHEIQNPVAAIKLHAQLLPGSVAEAELIGDEAARIETMLNQWMFLSKPEPPAMAELDAGRIITTSLGIHRRRLEHAQVRLEADAAEGISIRGDQRRLAQVFSNLIVNGIQAMPLGGVLAVTLRRAEGFADIAFADTGCGFSEAALRRFAEFFFSEKEGGMGIGLSVASEIVKAHGGELLVSNRAEGGARVTVRLPVCVL